MKINGAIKQDSTEERRLALRPINVSKSWFCYFWFVSEIVCFCTDQYYNTSLDSFVRIK